MFKLKLSTSITCVTPSYLIVSFLISLSAVSAAEVKTYYIRPGNCLYLKGSKVCALDPIYQTIVTEGVSVQLNSSTENNQLIIPNVGEKNLVIINKPKSGPDQYCKCPIRNTDEGLSYTIEKKTIDSSGNETRVFTKVTPSDDLCNCQ